MAKFTEREQLVEIVNKLFVYTDTKQWEKLQHEVFDTEVRLDMTSLGGANEVLKAAEICAMWDSGFGDLDAVNHLGGNYLVSLDSETEASVFAYATATHYKASAKKGQTREFVGTYDLKFTRKPDGWRIHGFTYTLKYMSGNADLE